MAKTKCFFRFIQEEDKQKFKTSSCLFTISVGQQTHEGEHFSSTIDLINESFHSCTMLVDDSLQRHSIALNRLQDPDYFYEISLKEGDLWLERNKQYYEKLTNLKNIIRWDTWLKHPNFHSQREAIKKMINEDVNYKNAFETSVTEFITRYEQRLQDKKYFDPERGKRLSFEFVLEECTALCLWANLNCNYEVYPNLHNSAINETRKRFVLAKYPHLLNPVTLGFRNAKQLAPQRFIYLEQEDFKTLGGAVTQNL